MFELNYFLNREKIPSKEELAEAFALMDPREHIRAPFFLSGRNKRKKIRNFLGKKTTKKVINAILIIKKMLMERNKKLSKKRKEIAQNFLKKVLEDIDDYIMQINNLKNLSNNSDSENIKDYQADYKMSDENRRDAQQINK